LRALLRQRLSTSGAGPKLLARIASHQLAHNRAPIKQTRRVRDDWETQLLAAEDHPLRQLALQNDLAMNRSLRSPAHSARKRTPAPGQSDRRARLHPAANRARIGEHLGLTILCEIGDIQRFPTVKDSLLQPADQSTVASAGKIKGLRGAKLGNPYLRWAFGEAAVIAKRDPAVIGPLAQRLEARMNGNKFKANTVLAIKLAAPSITCSKAKPSSTPNGSSPR